MNMTNQPLIIPLLVQVALTFVVWTWMLLSRIESMRRNKVSFQSLTTREGQERLSDVMKVSDNFENQFEIPVLFYALLVTLMFTYHSDATYLICAWLFVLTRAIHAIIHCTVNNVALRFTAHFLGSAILGAMWVRFAIQVL
jgi:hypothetical protein